MVVMPPRKPTTHRSFRDTKKKQQARVVKSTRNKKEVRVRVRGAGRGRGENSGEGFCLAVEVNERQRSREQSALPTNAVHLENLS